MKFLSVFTALFFMLELSAQTISEKLTTAITTLEKDEQFKHGSISMYVVDSKSGIVIFDKNSQLGMAPASCQKVVTSVTAFEMLGNNYQFKTTIGYDGELKNNSLTGNLYIIGYGDPTLGSWRWKQTKENVIIQEMLKAIVTKGIKNFQGNVFGYDRKWSSNTTPDGWIWQDIGNYYGAGASGLNWRENQYDLTMKAGDKIGAKASIVSIKPLLENAGLYCEVTTGPKGSGDNSYIYLPPYSFSGYVRGTIPLGENNFTISGSMPDPGGQLAQIISDSLKSKGAEVLFTGSYNGIEVDKKDIPINPTIIYNHLSPPLDSINYWFLKRSVNLYGEALVKTIGYEKAKEGSTDSGVNIIRSFWMKNGIEKSALKIIDGSGLSPANRVTTHALVTIMQYAKNKNWFPSFYNALPEANGIKMKDGYINGVRSYTGYIKSKSGNDYTFSFIVNNFDGSASTVREKMWKILDLLK